MQGNDWCQDVKDNAQNIMSFQKCVLDPNLSADVRV